MKSIFRDPIIQIIFFVMAVFLCVFSAFSTRSIVVPMENYTWNLGQLDREVLMASVLLQDLIKSQGDSGEAVTWLQFSSSRLDTLQNGVLRDDFNEMIELARDFESLHKLLDGLIFKLDTDSPASVDWEQVELDANAIVPLSRRIASLGIAAIQRKEVNDIYELRERGNITATVGLLMMCLSALSLYFFYRGRKGQRRHVILDPVYKALFSTVLDDILKHTPVTYVSTTLSGTVISSANTSSYDVKYWKGKNFFDQIEKNGYEYDPDINEIHRQVCRFNSWYGPITRRGIGNKISFGLLKVSRITDSNTDILHWVFTDITEQEVVRTKAIASERFAAIGEVTSGIAHEINQPLNVMSLVVENLQRHCNGDSLSVSYLNKKIHVVREQVLRMASIIEKMRLLSHGPIDKFMVFSLSDTVTQAIEESAARLQQVGIKVEVSIPQECSFLYGDEWATRQVFANIFRNSIDALQEFGETKLLKIQSWSANSDIFVAVSDTGPGIDEERIERVFEPFFSTKGLGSGSGLGLSICRSLMQRQGGTIHAEPSSTGARFVVKFKAPDKAII